MVGRTPTPIIFVPRESVYCQLCRVAKKGLTALRYASSVRQERDLAISFAATAAGVICVKYTRDLDPLSSMPWAPNATLAIKLPGGIHMAAAPSRREAQAMPPMKAEMPQRPIPGSASLHCRAIGSGGAASDSASSRASIRACRYVLSAAGPNTHTLQLR